LTAGKLLEFVTPLTYALPVLSTAVDGFQNPLKTAA
jgi:hypothetical protein